MRLRGTYLSGIAAFVAALMAVGGEGSASASTHSTSPIVECSADLNAFQEGRESGVLGQPWTRNQDLLNRSRRKCSLLGWYEGMRDYCTERSQLAAGAAKRHGLELCLFKDTRRAMNDDTMGMDALAEMLKDVKMSQPMSKAAASEKYKSLKSKLGQDSVALADTTCASAEDDDAFVGLERASVLQDYRISCYKSAIVAQALNTLETAPYTKWYKAHSIGFDYVTAEGALQLAKADIASTQELIQVNDARIANAYRTLYDTTNAGKQAQIKANIATLEGRQDSLRISLENAIDRRADLEVAFGAKQKAYQRAKAALSR